MTTSTYTPDVFDHAYRAATWLVDRHESATHLITRVDAWTTMYVDGDEVPAVNLDAITEGLNAYDRWRIAWDDYKYGNPMPSQYSYGDDEAAHQRACDRWEARGPKINNQFASRYAPMSSGEHRLFRMLGIFTGTRAQFSIFDMSVSFQCCSPGVFGGPRPHASFMADWAMLISGAALK